MVGGDLEPALRASGDACFGIRFLISGIFLDHIVPQ
jgi:hypothetical protein